MTIYIWHTGHQINETVSKALHAGIPHSILKHTNFANNYIHSNVRFTAIGYGILRGTAKIFHDHHNKNVDWYEADRGYINPDHFNGYYRISKRALQAKYKEGWEYPNDRLKKLHFSIKNTYNPKGHVLVVPPTEYIEEFYSHDRGSWLESIEDFLKTNKIKYKVRYKNATNKLQDDLFDCRAVTTFNSNVSVEATLNSVPVITGAYSVAGRWSKNTLHALVKDELTIPTKEEVDKFLRFLSYNQWTLDEIIEGKAWEMLTKPL